MPAERSQFLVLKYSLISFNILIFLSGWVLLVTSGIILNHYGDYNEYVHHRFADASVCTLIIGVALIAVGIVGAYSAFKESYRIVMWFSVLLSIVFIVEVVSGWVVFTYVRGIDAETEVALHKAVRDYEKSQEAKVMVDWIQITFECCGSRNSSDYKGLNITSCITGIVATCYRSGTCGGDLQEGGCHGEFATFLKNNLLLLGTVAGGLAVLFNSISICIGCLFMRILPDKDYSLI